VARTAGAGTGGGTLGPLAVAPTRAGSRLTVWAEGETEVEAGGVGAAAAGGTGFAKSLP
jgi:hypothetical protein